MYYLIQLHEECEKNNFPLYCIFSENRMSKYNNSEFKEVYEDYTNDEDTFNPSSQDNVQYFLENKKLYCKNESSLFGEVINEFSNLKDFISLYPEYFI